MSYTDAVVRLLVRELVADDVFGKPGLSITSVGNVPVPGQVLNLRVVYAYRGRDETYWYPLVEWEEYADDSPEGMAGGLANLVRIELVEMLESQPPG